MVSREYVLHRNPLGEVLALYGTIETHGSDWMGTKGPRLFAVFEAVFAFVCFLKRPCYWITRY